MITMTSKSRSHYSAEPHGTGWILVQDLSAGGPWASVTNDAEAVVRACLCCLPPNRRIAYRDTDGRWDELRHDDTKFIGFAPLSAADREAIGVT